MRTLTNILLIMTLGLTVFLCNRQESDIISLRHWNHMQEGGLESLKGGLAQLEGGLDSANGGLDLMWYRSCSAVVYVTEMSGGLIMQTTTSRGTGVFVSDNVMLTAKHMVEDRIADESVTAIGPDGMRYVAVEVLEDTDDDLAVVIFENRIGPWLELGVSPRLGDEVICIGTPLGEQDQLIITWGHVSSEKWKTNFIYDGFCWPGCSGGPVIVAGKLAGIVEARLVGTSSLGFATPIERLDTGLLARF